MEVTQQLESDAGEKPQEGKAIPLNQKEIRSQREKREKEERLVREADEIRAEQLLTLIGTTGAEIWTKAQFPEGKFVGIESSNKSGLSLGLGLQQEIPRPGGTNLRSMVVEYTQAPTTQKGQLDPRLSVDFDLGRTWSLPKDYSVAAGVSGSVDILHTTLAGATMGPLFMGNERKLPLWDIPNGGVFVGIQAPNGWSIALNGEINFASRWSVTPRVNEGQITSVTYVDEDGNVVGRSSLHGDYKKFTVDPQAGIGLQVTVPIQRL